jgi:hypothetical protein
VKGGFLLGLRCGNRLFENEAMGWRFASSEADIEQKGVFALWQYRGRTLVASTSASMLVVSAGKETISEAGDHFCPVYVDNGAVIDFG